jgi:UDP-N-acetylmuramoylalanine--D-glutamate ligase
MLGASEADYVVGGNIGVGLLGLLERIGPDTKVMLELSHTQLESVARSPHLACVTNVTPNHLDQFSWSQYVALKRRIFEFQQPGDTCIFSLDNEVTAAFAKEAPAGVAYTSITRPLPGDGVMLSNNVATRIEAGREFPVLRRDEIRLRGTHNVENVLSAIALASRLGVSDEAAADAVRGFTGVPHRLEPVAVIAGVQYINDSIATTPERTLAGMRSFEEPLVLLLGGRHKYLPVGELASEAVRRCRAVITFGEAGEMFAAAIRDAHEGDSLTIEHAGDVDSAVRAASRLARSGDVVLFAPAGSSFDAYPNFERRGAAFREAVRHLEGGA